MKPPRLQVTCDCGATGSAIAGDLWTCETCGSRFSTAIPRETAAAITAVTRRYRAIAAILAVAFAATILAILLADDLFLLFAGIPGLLMAWFLLGRPFLRARVHRAVSRLPAIELRRERDLDRR